jgi:hypothetical protein
VGKAPLGPRPVPRRGRSPREKLTGNLRPDGQNAVVAGRKRLLTPDLVTELVANLAAHGSLETACAATGISARSVRRWRAEGRREFDGLSAEARLALELDRASGARTNSRRHGDDAWRNAARWLEQLYPERWGPPSDLDALLAQFGEE